MFLMYYTRYEVIFRGIEKKNYSFRFHEDMVERLRAQAQLENRSLSNLVETILLQYLSTLEEKTT